MGRSMPKFSSFSPPYSGEEKMLSQLDLAGKVVYLLILIVLLLLYLQKWKRNCRGGRHVQTTNRVNIVRGDNGGETIRGQIARRSRANIAMRVTTGGQYAGGFEVVGDDEGGTINGDIAMGVTTGGQYAERFEVVGDNEGGTINGDIAMGVTTGGQYPERFEVVGDNEGGTINGDFAMGVTTGGQYAGEVRFDVTGDDDDGTINGEIAMGRTSLAATMPFEFN
ncbi:uncharacterized protein LOC142622296 isoform X1 [Castanea sativa]|uniref:uncharacterized protein LOC142622296 isoform X1 n=1 Tax=Castanea sativa TaxID=21020 RepID=UPI003F64ABB5